MAIPALFDNRSSPMRTLLSTLILASLSLSAAACADDSDPGTRIDDLSAKRVPNGGRCPDNAPCANASSSEVVPPPQEPTPGVVNPAAAYCLELGYQAKDEVCILPDASVCDQWAFFRGECGQAFSHCEKQGGTISNEVRSQGTSTTSEAICTLPDGTECSEQDFARTGTCK